MRSVEYARTHGVDLEVRSAFTWDRGTLVHKEDNDMEHAIISAVVHDTDEAKVTVAGVPRPPRPWPDGCSRAWPERTSNVDLIVQKHVRAGPHRHSFTCPGRGRYVPGRVRGTGR